MFVLVIAPDVPMLTGRVELRCSAKLLPAPLKMMLPLVTVSVLVVPPTAPSSRNLLAPALSMVSELIVRAIGTIGLVAVVPTILKLFAGKKIVVWRNGVVWSTSRFSSVSSASVNPRTPRFWS